MRKLKKMIKNFKAKAEELKNNLLSLTAKTTKIALGAAGLALLALLALSILDATSAKHPKEITAKVTNIQGTGGGSGSIISRSPSLSEVLTNAHVCKGALKDGGKITLTDGSEHMVIRYYLSDVHDLCVVQVAADLKNTVKVRKDAPAVYEPALVTGHPALMPNIITNGHFGGKQIIPLMVGVRKCKESDFKNRESAPFCMFFGVVPVIKNYESQVLSATIMKGSSGSPVLDKEGKLAGVVFAGNADGLSYSYIVPAESVINFLNDELPALKSSGDYFHYPESVSGDSGEEEETLDRKEGYQIFKEKCAENQESIDNEYIKNFCKELLTNIKI